MPQPGSAAVRTPDPPRGLLARGLGRSYGDAPLNAGGVVLLTSGVSGIRTLAPAGTVSVDAGVSLGRLVQALLPHGWLPAVLPGTAHVTVGGAIAADIHGKNHHRDGGFCGWVTRLTLQAPGREPRTVTPGADPEVFWATAGGMGLTGVILDAALRLQQVETAWMRAETVRMRDLDETVARLAELDVQHRYAVAWLDLRLAAAARQGSAHEGGSGAGTSCPTGSPAIPSTRDPAPMCPSPTSSPPGCCGTV
jgi:decaprenylphospho-beta-D-ribofuranose 2-oxidase